MTNINAADEPDVRAAVARHRLFAGLPDDVVDTLVERSSELRRDAGEHFFRDGGDARHYLLVHSGRIEMVRVGIDGDERVARVFGPGDLVAEAAMFMAHARYPMSARAAVPSSVFALARDSLHAACRRFPDLAMRLLAAMSERLYRTVNEVSALASASAPERLAAWFVEQTRLQGSTRLTMPMPLNQLAGHIGIRPETLSRILSQWTQQGVLRGRAGNWEVVSPTDLERLAEAAVRPF